MTTLRLERLDDIAVITLAHGKVNAIDETMVHDLAATFGILKEDTSTRAAILTGQGKFFSFGFDVPHFYDYPREQFSVFIREFCELYRSMFLFPKPLIGAINGHAVAGGCILALATDCRFLVNESAKMSLNEVTFGASLFAGVVEMLRYQHSSAAAEEVLLTGAMFSPQESKALGMAHQLVSADLLMAKAVETARTMARNSGPAFASLKRHLRQPIVDGWMEREEASIEEWLSIWYSAATREQTKAIQIR